MNCILKVDGVGSREWLFPVAVLLSSICFLSLIYWQTATTIVATWGSSETFAHGYLIVPISVYLIWIQRNQLLQLVPVPDYRPLVLLFLLGFIWLLAYLIGIQVLQQYCFVGMIPLLVWTLLGWDVTKKILFPLGFLLFAVPTGEFMIPTLLQFTADFTVSLVRLVGIPIYRDGNYFSLPSGDWSVVKACSGIRYLIASVTLGCLYAYISYRSLWRRSAFIVLAVLFPIVANGLRAFVIVMIGHFSKMKLAVGVDHLIYGWVFFGMVMLIMFWIGGCWKENTEHSDQHRIPESVSNPPIAKKHVIILFAGAALILVSIWPVRAAYISVGVADVGETVELSAPKNVLPWRQLDKTIDDWHPSYTGYSKQEKFVYIDDEQIPVNVYLIYYPNQVQGRELVNSENLLVAPDDPGWKILTHSGISVTIDNQLQNVEQSRLISGRRPYLVWRLNWVNGVFTPSALYTKILEAKQKLSGKNTDGAALVLRTEYDEKLEISKSRLQRFASVMLPSIDAALRDTGKK